MNYTCLVIVQFELNFVGGHKRKGVKNMKNSFSVDFHLTLDLDNSIDMYLYEYLLYVRNQLIDSSSSNILYNVILFASHKDKDFMSLSDYIDNVLLCNSEDNKNE